MQMLMRTSYRIGAGKRPPGRRVALAALLAVTLILMTSLPARADFSKVTVTDIIYNPEKPQPGTSFSLSVTVQNTYNQEIRVKWFGVHYDWMATNIYVYQDFSSSPMAIAPLTKFTFTVSVTIPANTSFSIHPYNFKMGFETQGITYTETTNDYLDFFLEKYIPPEPTPIWQQPLFIGAIVMVVVLILVIMVLLLVRKRKLDRDAASKRIEFKTTEQAQSQEDVELARTVTKGSGSIRMDSKVQPKQWETPPDQRYTGQQPTPPIYKVLSPAGAQQPQQQPSAPPLSQPSAPPQVQPRMAPQAMPQGPPPLPPPMTPGGMPPPLPPAISKEQATLHQCPMCGKMNKASDTVCPKCGHKY